MNTGSVQSTYRGIDLRLWSQKTPYNLLSCFVERPVMRVSKHGKLYMAGFSPVLGCTVALHYQRRSRMHDLPARYLIKWSSGRPGESQNVRSFTSLNDVEAFLRPPAQDVSWLERLTEQKRRIAVAALSHALVGNHRQLEGDDLRAAGEFLYHLESNTGSMSPWQFEVPADSRAILWASLRWMLMRKAEKLELDDGQYELAGKLLAACGLDAGLSPAM